MASIVVLSLAGDKRESSESEILSRTAVFIIGIKGRMQAIIFPPRRLRGDLEIFL